MLKSFRDTGHSDVRVFPPFLFAGALAAGIVAGRGEKSDSFGARVAGGVGTASIVAGAAIFATAVVQFKRLGTNLDVREETTALATDGIFALTRNPVYVGLTSVYVGIALRARSIPALVLLPIVLAKVDSLVVDREERYLERKFGKRYRTYRERVPRWF